MASEGKTVNTGRREGSGIMVNEGGRCHMILKESIELLILLLQGEQSFSCVPFRWQGNWIRRGAKRPENPVTRFPAGRRGPRSGEGVLEGKNRKETQSRAGRLSAVRITVECHIGAWPRTPYGPSRGSEGGRREIFESYSSCTIPTVPPLVAAPPPFPLFRGHYGCWAFESIYVYGGNAGKPSQPPLRARPGCKGFRPRSGLSKLRPKGATTTL